MHEFIKKRTILLKTSGTLTNSSKEKINFFSDFVEVMGEIIMVFRDFIEVMSDFIRVISDFDNVSREIIEVIRNFVDVSGEKIVFFSDFVDVFRERVVVIREICKGSRGFCLVIGDLNLYTENRTRIVMMIMIYADFKS